MIAKLKSGIVRAWIAFRQHWNRCSEGLIGVEVVTLPELFTKCGVDFDPSVNYQATLRLNKMPLWSMCFDPENPDRFAVKNGDVLSIPGRDIVLKGF